MIMYKHQKPEHYNTKGFNETLGDVYSSEGNYAMAFKEYNRAAGLASTHDEWKRLNDLATKAFMEIDDNEE